MASLNGFDANQVEPAVGFEPIPAGKYVAAITESEEKPTKSGGGNYLKLTFQVLEGEHKGRLLWARLNLENSNATTVKIARAELSAICRAVGVLAPKVSEQLHDLPLVITVGQKKRADTGEMGNVIKGYEKRGAAQTRPNAAATTAATTAAKGPAPWKR